MKSLSVRRSPPIVPASWFIDTGLKVGRVDADVSTLEKSPKQDLESLETVGVNPSPDLLEHMVDHSVQVVLRNPAAPRTR